MHFSTFSTDVVYWNVQKVKKWLPRGASEKFSAVFQVKMSQINTGNGKEPKIFQFPKALCISC